MCSSTAPLLLWQAIYISNIAGIQPAMKDKSSQIRRRNHQVKSPCFHMVCIDVMSATCSHMVQCFARPYLYDYWHVLRYRCWYCLSNIQPKAFVVHIRSLRYVILPSAMDGK